MEPISATVTAALATLRIAKEFAKQIKSADLTEKLQDAYDRIGDIRHQIFALEDENRRLAKENEELKANKILKSELQFDGQMYWRMVDGKQVGPYCPNCWHDPKHHQLMPLQHKKTGEFFCTIHLQYFQSPNAAGVETGPTIRPFGVQRRRRPFNSR